LLHLIFSRFDVLVEINSGQNLGGKEKYFYCNNDAFI